MVVKVFIKEHSEKTEQVRSLARVLEEIRHEGYKVEEFDPDTPLGGDIASVYDVVAPSVLILRDNGSEIFGWRGTVPRSAGDIRYFLGHQINKLNPVGIRKIIHRSKNQAGVEKHSSKKTTPTEAKNYPLKKERTTLKRVKKTK